MSEYVSEEEAKRREQHDTDQARYHAQVSIAASLNNFIKSLESQKEQAEMLRNWVTADQWRDHSIKNLEDRMKRTEEQGKRIEGMFNHELRKMRGSLSSHMYDDFDWTLHYYRLRESSFDLNSRFKTIENEHKLLMTKMLEVEQGMTLLRLKDAPIGGPASKAMKLDEPLLKPQEEEEEKSE